MNNRNQNQASLPAIEPAATPSYLNVFTVEEYESNGKTQKRWTRIGAAFPHKEGAGSTLNSKHSRSTEDRSLYRPTPTREYPRLNGDPENKCDPPSIDEAKRVKRPLGRPRRGESRSDE
jgi:hypothetical protein